MKAELYAKSWNIFQQFKKIKTPYENLPPKKVAELKP